MAPRISDEIPRIAPDDWDAYSYYVLTTLAELKRSHELINAMLAALSERLSNITTSLAVLNYKVFLAGTVVGSVAGLVGAWALMHFGK